MLGEILRLIEDSCRSSACVLDLGQKEQLEEIIRVFAVRFQQMEDGLEHCVAQSKVDATGNRVVPLSLVLNALHGNGDNRELMREKYGV